MDGGHQKRIFVTERHILICINFSQEKYANYFEFAKNQFFIQFKILIPQKRALMSFCRKSIFKGLFSCIFKTQKSLKVRLFNKLTHFLMDSRGPLSAFWSSAGFFGFPQSSDFARFSQDQNYRN